MLNQILDRDGSSLSQLPRNRFRQVEKPLTPPPFNKMSYQQTGDRRARNGCGSRDPALAHFMRRRSRTKKEPGNNGKP
ncbi:unnamed protein product [Arctogadus glacialis]